MAAVGNTTFVAVKDVSYTLVQGQSSNDVLWVAHDGSGNTVDLSALSGNLYLSNAPVLYDGAFYMTMTWPVELTNTGNIQLAVTEADTANAYPGDYLFQVTVASSNASAVAVSGIMTIQPNLGVAPLPSANASGNTDIFPPNPSDLTSNTP